MGYSSRQQAAKRLSAILLAFLFSHGVSAEDPERHFDETVAPLLARRCLECHNNSDRKGGLDLSHSETTQQGGDTGKVIVPGKPDESLLWQYVKDDEMPPENPLAADEKVILKEWIEKGAGWGRTAIDPLRYTTDRRAGYDWWALQPLSTDGLASSVGATLSHEFVRNPIDAFVIHSLLDRAVSPSPEADRRTLIRRLSFDLRGLPPTPREIEEFAGDRSAGAYERLVDRLLASPQYGERWARHWLDIARFGESQGFERDKLRTNAWRYRDWVVGALNSDLPYDEFARQQLAGDVFGPNSASLVATGFLVAGPYDEVGQSQQSAAMKAIVRQDELEDIVSLVGQTFLGLTINCARCHDHKFDPITQKEYYQLTAALAGVRHGQPTAINDLSTAAALNAKKNIASRIKHLAAQVDEIDKPIRERILADRGNIVESVERPQPMSVWEFNEDFQDSIGGLHGEPHGNARVSNGWLLLDGKSFVATAPLATDLTEKTLEAWVTVFGLDQRGGGVISVQNQDGGLFDAIVYGERERRHWLAGSNGLTRTNSFSGYAETKAQPEPVHVAIVYANDGTITAYRNGQAYGKAYMTSSLAVFKAGTAQVIFGLRHSPTGGNRFFVGSIDRAQLYSRALSPAEVAASAGTSNETVREIEILPHLSPEQQRRRAELQFEVGQLRSQQSRYDEPTVYAVAPREPEPCRLLARGNTTQPKEVVAAGGVASLVGSDADFGLPADAPEAERRKKLAQWIADPRNPLFARVIVNRLWHYHFGTGLVDTPNDFGFNGGRPTHPQLIDWLAGELIRNDWSLKAVHRTILISGTYRQSSRYDEKRAGLDAGNRYLWRKTPLRLEAEAVRDAILAVSGQLNKTMHGPGYHDFRTFSSNSQFYEMLDPSGPTFHRRSIYRTWVRSGRSRFLDVFDCPDPSAKAPSRVVTTTPLQALSLLNNSFVLRMADRFAERAARQADSDHEAQTRMVYRLAFGRRPTGRELAASVSFVEQHGLSAFCRVIFNSNEFLYVD